MCSGGRAVVSHRRCQKVYAWGVGGGNDPLLGVKWKKVQHCKSPSNQSYGAMTPKAGRGWKHSETRRHSKKHKRVDRSFIVY